MDESKRQKPDPRNGEIYRILKEQFRGLSERVRGEISDVDPFARRADLLEKRT
jgi:hypothetical protein